MQYTYKIYAAGLMMSAIGLTSMPAVANEDTSGFFVGARAGLYEGYEKSAVLVSGKTIEGTFKANGVGLQLGYDGGSWRAFAEYNPETDAEVAGEVAPLSSIVIAADYSVWQTQKQAVGLGAFIADAEFELEVGPKGSLFQNNPTASGMTYGLLANYRYSVTDNWVLGADLRYALSSFDGDGNALNGDPIKIEIKNYTQVNFTAAYRF